MNFLIESKNKTKNMGGGHVMCVLYICPAVCGVGTGAGRKEVKMTDRFIGGKQFVLARFLVNIALVISWTEF